MLLSYIMLNDIIAKIMVQMLADSINYYQRSSLDTALIKVHCSHNIDHEHWSVIALLPAHYARVVRCYSSSFGNLQVFIGWKACEGCWLALFVCVCHFSFSTWTRKWSLLTQTDI